ncbi:MAG: hypothetical protein JWN15_4208 [Firmicutes bacterium]|nr:hypothetical protein [Bacillota bacterium]
MKFLESVTQLCIGVWVGAMTGFAMTAPQLFSTFGTERQRAGDLAGAMIWRINTVGMVLGAIALVALLPRLRQGLNRWRTALLVAALALSLTGAFYIFPQLTQARPPRPIEQYAETDPVRVNYNAWHKRSEQVFGIAIILGAGVILLGPLGKGKGKEAN